MILTYLLVFGVELYHGIKGNTSNEIDDICINNRWHSSLQDVRAYRGADVGSDHNLVIGKIYLKLNKATESEVKKTYATEKRKEQTASDNFRIETRNGIAASEHTTDLEEQAQQIYWGREEEPIRRGGFPVRHGT